MSVKSVLAPEVPTSQPSRPRAQDRGAFGSHLEGDAVLVCSGELDGVTNPALRRSLRRVMLLGPDRVVVDMSRVSFFDAGAIDELVRARKTSRAAGGDLVVRAPSPFGRRVLDIVGLTNLIAIEPRAAMELSGAPAAVGAYVAEVVDAYVAELVAAVHLPEPTAELTGRFTDANRSSVVIDGAKGLIAEHFDIGIDDASIALRGFSAAQHQTMRTAAGAVVDRTVAVASLAPHLPGQPVAADVDPRQAASTVAHRAGPEHGR